MAKRIAADWRTRLFPRLQSAIARDDVTRRDLHSEVAALLPKAVVRRGNPTRLRRALRAASLGEHVRYAAIGGSITRGGNASKQTLRYADLVHQWWQQTFPRLDMIYINAGIGGTGSNYGAHRAWNDVLRYAPDFVIVEFAVNDDNNRDFAITMEGLLRQILNHPNESAVVLLAEMKNDGTNAQEWHDKVAAHYDLTSLSVRDALWPEIAAGRMAWSDFVADHIHPNDRGHRIAADIVCYYLDEVLGSLTRTRFGRPARVPPAMLSTEYERTTYQKAEAIACVKNDGWAIGETSWVEVCLEATRPGARLECEVEGTSIHLVYHRLRADFGTVSITIDDRPPQIVDSWFSGTWGGINFCYKVADSLPPGRHRVRIEVLEQRAAESTGHRFQLIGVMTAGVDRSR